MLVCFPHPQVHADTLYTLPSVHEVKNLFRQPSPFILLWQQTSAVDQLQESSLGLACSYAVWPIPSLPWCIISLSMYVSNIPYRKKNVSKSLHWGGYMQSDLQLQGISHLHPLRLANIVIHKARVDSSFLALWVLQNLCKKGCRSNHHSFLFLFCDADYLSIEVCCQLKRHKTEIETPSVCNSVWTISKLNNHTYLHDMFSKIKCSENGCSHIKE